MQKNRLGERCWDMREGVSQGTICETRAADTCRRQVDVMGFHDGTRANFLRVADQNEAAGAADAARACKSQPSSLNNRELLRSNAPCTIIDVTLRPRPGLSHHLRYESTEMALNTQ